MKKNPRDIMKQQLLKRGLFGCLVAIHEGDQMSGSFVSSKYNSYVYMLLHLQYYVPWPLVLRIKMVMLPSHALFS